MKLKNRKKTIALFLSLMLATTGCSKAGETDVKEGYQDKIETVLEYNKLYSGTSAFEKNKFTYNDFYNTFFCAAIENMTDEEYLDFSKELDRVTTYNYEMRDLFNCIDNMLVLDKNAVGYGFYLMILNQLEDSSLNSHPETFFHINTLRTLVNNDAEFFSSIFSRDINKVIDCICQNTHVQDRALVEELILKLDQYYDVSTPYDYQEQKLAEMYEIRIQEIMNIIVKTKCESDKVFSQTLYAKYLKESKYYNQSDVFIYQSLFGLNGYVINDNYPNFPYRMPITHHDLLSDTSIAEAKSHAVEHYISYATDKATKDYEKKFFDLFVMLLDEDALGSYSSDYKTSEEMRSSIYENLKSHFASEEEFDTFFLSFYLEKPSAQEFYLKLFNDRLKDDGITYYDFIRYTALIKYIDDNTTTRFHEQDIDVFFTLPIAYGDLVKMPQSEYEEYVHPYQENWLFNYQVPYHQYLEEGYDILTHNNLGFKEFYNPTCRIGYDYGYLYARYTSPYVTSDLVSPKEGTYNGSKVIYYEYPEFYEDGEAVETFKNIEDEFTIRTVPGFKVEITDPETGEPKYIYIVSIGGSPDDFPSVRFGTFYANFDKAKNLLLGGTYE